MAELVYHRLDAESGALSPFVERIHVIAERSHLCLACPYVGMGVLRPILKKAKSWRLLTDVEELLSSQVPSQRAEVVRFLKANQAKVRHWPGLHAKVVIGNASALVGSANLTTKGLGQRQEMAVVLQGQRPVNELRAWFDGLWSRCSSVDADELGALLGALPRSCPEKPAVCLKSPAPSVSALVVPPAEVSASAATKLSGEDRLRRRLAYGVSGDWVNAFLDVAADLLETLGIPEDDLRLSMSIPKSNKALGVTVNQRYVLSAFSKGRKTIGLMLPRNVVIPDALLPAMRRVRDRLGSFRQWRGERSEDVPHSAYFEVDDPRELLPLRDEWLFAVLQETERAWKQSSYRSRHHVPEFHRAVVDSAYRATLLPQVATEAP